MKGMLTADLSALGFKRCDRLSVYQTQKYLTWWVHEIQGSHADSQSRFQIGIGIDDPFREDHGFRLLCLAGDVEPHGITFHFDQTPFWWGNLQSEAVQGVLVSCAIPALKFWTVEELVRYFEKPAAKVSFLTGSAACVGPKFDCTPVSRRPPIHSLWLSLLSYHQKDYCRSLAYTELWFNSVKHLKDDEIEPGRTLAQFVALNESVKNKL